MKKKLFGNFWRKDRKYYLEELDFSMIFNEKGGILQYVTSDEGKVEREYCRLI